MPLARTALRIAALFYTVLGALFDFLRIRITSRNGVSAEQRAHWLHRWCRKGLPRFGIHFTVDGTTPSSGLLVSNHLSYLDILVLSATVPCVFVSKQEIASWPVFGWMSRMAGTIFVNRARAADTHAARPEMEQRLSEGLLVVLFPEGTSSDGTTVLPFRSSLFEAAIAAGVGISAAHIRYETSAGRPETDVCYWGEMTLAPHVLKLFSIRRVSARIRFSGGARHFADRKEAARKLYEEVVALHESSGSPQLFESAC